jgi:NADH:ubiquinone oxidoreductase subunit 2 (subunit N)
MNAATFFDPQSVALWSAAVALLAGLVLLGMERPGRPGIVPVAALGALAAAVGLAGLGRVTWMPLAIGLVVGALARDGDELLHGECAIKLLWVLGSAFALSWAGLQLLTLATGTPIVVEQWAVLELGLEPRFLWNTALPLSLLAGLVLLGGAPFHFWVADVFQGVRPWLAPLAVAALQVSGAGWLGLRLESIASFPPGAELVGAVLRYAALAAFAAGATTLIVQRRPERRVGTLASLNGALVLARLAAGPGLDPAWLGLWAAHTALALTGASTLARFLPVSAARPGPGAPIMRAHPAAAIAGLYALFSLAGLPGTPGALLWLEVARALATSGSTVLMLALAAAWLASISVVLGQLRESWGVPAPPRSHVRSVPIESRLALWLAGAGLVVLVARWFAARA